MMELVVFFGIFFWIVGIGVAGGLLERNGAEGSEYLLSAFSWLTVKSIVDMNIQQRAIDRAIEKTMRDLPEIIRELEK